MQMETCGFSHRLPPVENPVGIFDGLQSVLMFIWGGFEQLGGFVSLGWK